MIARGIKRVVFAALLAGAVSPAVADEVELKVVTDKGRFIFSVEVAETAAQRQQGLQHRKNLAASAGMLFDYKRVQPVAMWMKNTLIPLDMLFIDGAGRIVNVARDTEPMSLATIPSAAPVLAVLEVNAGTARRLGIQPGDRVLHAIFGNAR
ncbi:MAG: DUF192 domain-containing protein [Rhodospirillales bacterium]|jgi:hypothetical protein|nr:DUF192 domain-containing protein [Rhodospirillales bacterium]